jgi:hypothetical protein
MATDMFAIPKNTCPGARREPGRQTLSIMSVVHPSSSVSGKDRSTIPISTNIRLKETSPAICGISTRRMEAATAIARMAVNFIKSGGCQRANALK